MLSRPVLEVAPQLLGAHLRVGEVTVRLTEVEAYAGEQDPGSHAHRGRTPRTGVMFGPAGRLYCYLSYGVHTCANVVTGPDGEAAAVLLRAGEVVDGLALARGRRPGARDRDLARGPGRLCRTLGVELAHDGADVCGDSGVTLTLPAEGEAEALRPRVRWGPRVGLSLAADRPWRCWLAGEETVSVYRRSPRATPIGNSG
ncbi:DNA-3-methyladenine glycosylase [Nocardioides nanhaiensis]|uniref:DNA-3-methyladenine glycosylase n=1 Tax=Nocardioides nanhaiensis TaxID=1476871 RepID=UPI0031E77860